MKAQGKFDIIVIGGGHAGAEAAWAAANMLRTGRSPSDYGSVALITMDPAKTGAMSCNPAIGGLAKGQIVREIDALGGLMGLAADATGIQFRVLNQSKGPAVRGPRCQSDKYRYAREVQRLLGTRPNLTLLGGTVERFVVGSGRITGVIHKADAHFNAPRESGDCCGEFGSIDASEKPVLLEAKAVVLTTGTFMRALMHTGESQTEGGRVDEGSAVGISGALKSLGFELGRLKTGTPPRLARETLDLSSLQEQPGDDEPVPFSDMTRRLAGGATGELEQLKHGDGDPRGALNLDSTYDRITNVFPSLPQTPCWLTETSAVVHDAIRANLERAPMYNGQIETAGPRYCPSIEDKVVRFADKMSHHVFLEPESLETNEMYCNGISTSLPADVQDVIVRNLPGCERAKVLRYGYAVEYDMVWPHQIDATCMTKRVEGLFVAGQINGTSGYEEAAAQGLLAGLNAARYLNNESLVRLRRDQAYIGVLMDDLVTKTPREPYRMFTSRAEFRLLLRADNSDLRLTELARDWGLVDDARWDVFSERKQAIESLRAWLQATKVDGARLIDWAKRPEVDVAALRGRINGESLPSRCHDPHVLATLLADIQYAGYIDRQYREVEKLANQEATPLPSQFAYEHVEGLRNEAKAVLTKFKPTTMGQASRLAGVTPADLMLLTVAIGR